MLSELKKCCANIDNSCYETSVDLNFDIYDCPTSGRCYIDRGQQIASLKFSVDNPAKKLIHFFAIDRCIIPPHGDKRCDCLVTDDKTFCFIEIKELQDATIPLGPRKRKAKLQLLTTIELFRSTIDTIENYSLEAYMCVSGVGKRPSVLAVDIHTRMQFAQVNTAIYEGTTKTF